MSTRVAFSALMVTIIIGVAAYCWLLITGRRAVFDYLEFEVVRAREQQQESVDSINALLRTYRGRVVEDDSDNDDADEITVDVDDRNGEITRRGILHHDYTVYYTEQDLQSDFRHQLISPSSVDITSADPPNINVSFASSTPHSETENESLNIDFVKHESEAGGVEDYNEGVDSKCEHLRSIYGEVKQYSTFGFDANPCHVTSSVLLPLHALDHITCPGNNTQMIDEHATTQINAFDIHDSCAEPTVAMAQIKRAPLNRLSPSPPISAFVDPLSTDSNAIVSVIITNDRLSTSSNMRPTVEGRPATDTLLISPSFYDGFNAASIREIGCPVHPFFAPPFLSAVTKNSLTNIGSTAHADKLDSTQISPTFPLRLSESNGNSVPCFTTSTTPHLLALPPLAPRARSQPFYLSPLGAVPSTNVVSSGGLGGAMHVIADGSSSPVAIPTLSTLTVTNSNPLKRATSLSLATAPGFESGDSNMSAESAGLATTPRAPVIHTNKMRTSGQHLVLKPTLNRCETVPANNNIDTMARATLNSPQSGFALPSPAISKSILAKLDRLRHRRPGAEPIPQGVLLEYLDRANDLRTCASGQQIQQSPSLFRRPSNNIQTIGAVEPAPLCPYPGLAIPSLPLGSNKIAKTREKYLEETKNLPLTSRSPLIPSILPSSHHRHSASDTTMRPQRGIATPLQTDSTLVPLIISPSPSLRSNADNDMSKLHPLQSPPISSHLQRPTHVVKVCHLPPLLENDELALSELGRGVFTEGQSPDKSHKITAPASTPLSRPDLRCLSLDSKYKTRRSNERALELYHAANRSLSIAVPISPQPANSPLNTAQSMEFTQRSALFILAASLTLATEAAPLLRRVNSRGDEDVLMDSITADEIFTLLQGTIHDGPRDTSVAIEIDSPLLAPAKPLSVAQAESSVVPLLTGVTHVITLQQCDDDVAAIATASAYVVKESYANIDSHSVMVKEDPTGLIGDCVIAPESNAGKSVAFLTSSHKNEYLTGQVSVVEHTDLELATITVPTRQLFAYIFLLQALPISRLYLPPLTASALRWLDGSQWTVVATLLSCLGSSQDSGGGNDGGIGVYATLLPLLLLFGMTALSAAVLWVPTATTGSSSLTSISDDEDGVSTDDGSVSVFHLRPWTHALAKEKTTVYFENETMRARALTILLQLQWALVFPFSLQLARLCDCDSVDDIFYWRSDSNVECFVSGHLKAFLVILTLSFVWLIAVAFQIAAATNWRGVLPPIQFRARLGHLTDAYFDEWYLFDAVHILFCFTLLILWYTISNLLVLSQITALVCLLYLGVLLLGAPFKNRYHDSFAVLATTQFMLISLASNQFQTLSLSATGSPMITMYWSDLTPPLQVYDICLLCMFSVTLLIGIARSLGTLWTIHRCG